MSPILKAESDYLNEPSFLLKTISMESEEIRFGHSIDDKDAEDVSYFDLIHNFKLPISLLAIYLAAFLVIIFIGFAFHEITQKIKCKAFKKKRLIKKLATILRLFFSGNKFFTIGVFFVFVLLFIWFSQLFLTNNIKTNKVHLKTRLYFD